MKKKQAWTLVCGLTIISILVLTQLGSRAVTTIAQYSPIERAHCIIIDAGHGGEDGGAVSCSGIPESTYNLDIAMRLNDLFRLLGYQTKMTRTSDISIYTHGDTLAQKKLSDLKERIRIINQEEAGILISIHQNFFPDSQYKGAQVFYANTSTSAELAKQLQDAFITHLNPDNKRQSKKGEGIYLMEHISRPGLLIECGFLSNPQEEAKLRSKKYQQNLCCVIVAAIDGSLSNT